MELAEQVADLLKQSQALHAQAKPPAGRPRVRAHALERWGEAKALRVQAHELDPEHESPAWGEERVQHAAMMAFYDEQGVS